MINEKILEGLNKIATRKDYLYNASRSAYKGLKNSVIKVHGINNKIFGGTLGTLATYSQIPDLAKKTKNNINFNNQNRNLEVSNNFYTGDGK